MSKEGTRPSLDARIAMGIDPEWRQTIIDFISPTAIPPTNQLIDDPVLLVANKMAHGELYPNGASEERILELVKGQAKLGNRLRASILSQGFYYSDEVPSEIRTTFDISQPNSAVSVRDYGEILFASFQFSHGVDGFNRVVEINKVSKFAFPSFGDAANWYKPLRVLGNSSLSQTVPSCSIEEFQKIHRIIRASYEY